jgi:arylformamidase
LTGQTPDNEAWREWSLEKLEREYSPSSCVPSITPFLEAYVSRSQAAAKELPNRANLKWGEGADELFDFFPAASPTAPLLVFFHGGYWQEHSKDDVLFVAANCVRNGIAYVSVNYTLAPNITVAGIVDQCRRAVRAIHNQSKELGFDSHRLFVAGSSAGAHLASMMLLEDWKTGTEKGTEKIAGAILLSGVYDLAPLVPTYINGALSLNDEKARQVSPLYQPLGPPVPVIVAWGENEPSEFKRQGQTFATALQNAKFLVTSLEVPIANHFDIVFEIADPATTLGRLSLSMIQSETSK